MPVVLNARRPGREGTGSPSSFYTDPPTLAAARFFGGTNEIPGCATGSTFACPLGALHLDHPAADGPGVLVVRPEALRLLGADGAPNTVTATVRETRFHGTHRTLVAVTGGTVLTATVAPAVPVESGDRIHLQLPPRQPAGCSPGRHPGSTPPTPARTRTPVREQHIDVPLDGVVLTDVSTVTPST